MFPCLIFHLIFKEKYFSFYILLIDQISLSSCLYFVKYLAICVLQLFANQVVTSNLWSQTYLANEVIVRTWPKSRDKNLNVLRTRRGSDFNEIKLLSSKNAFSRVNFGFWGNKESEYDEQSSVLDLPKEFWLVH